MDNTSNQGATEAPSHSSDLSNPRADQIVLWGVNDDGSCRCPNGSACPPKNRGKHPKCAPYEPGDNLGNLTGAKYDRIYVDVDVRGGADGFGELMALPGFSEPNTRTVATATGGAHLEFKHPGFRVGNGKLAPHVDVRGDAVTEDGWAYVVAPGSRIVLDDGSIGEHTLVNDVEPSECPDWLLSALLTRATAKKASVPVEAIDESHPEWAYRVRLGEEAAKTYEPSRGDGEASRRLCALAARLKLDLELPIDVARQLVEEHFNPRCTRDGGSPWAWEPADIERALENACREQRWVMNEATTRGIAELRERLSTPPAARNLDAAPAHERKRPNPEHVYKYTGALSSHPNAQVAKFNELVRRFTLDPEWKGCWQLDEFRGRVICVDPPVKLDAERGEFSDEDASTIRSYLEHLGILATEQNIKNAVKVAARNMRFHPVLEYLRSLPPASGAIAELCDVLGVKDDLGRAYVRKTLLAAVRRIERPGCKVDTVLVFRGEPGRKKSACVPALFGEEFIAENLRDLSDAKNVGEIMQGRWAVEWAELDGAFRENRDACIAFITRREDTFRGAYKPGNASNHQRSSVLIGTVNGDEVYRDVHGADVRRLWIVDVADRIDTARVRELRDAVWSEAYAATRADVWHGSELVKGEHHWLDEDQEKAHAERAIAYREVHPWTSSVEGYLHGKKEVRADDVLSFVVGGDKSKMTPQAKRTVCGILKRVCGESQEAWRNGKTVRVYAVPETLANASTSARVVALGARSAG